jgi:murein DD-endopeptidase MepM/ murein hydrolase activator NlpD
LTTTKLANELIFNSNKVIDLRKDIIKINDIKLDYNKVINFSNITINKGDNLNKILSSFIYDKKKLKSIINSFKKFKDPSKIKSGTVLQVIKNNKNILGFYIPINSEEYLITYAKEGIYKSEIIKIIKAKSFLKKNIYIEYRNKNNLITRIDLFNNSSYDVYEKTLAKGQSIYQLLKNLDVNNKDINNILTKIKPFYDLRQILVGDKLDIIFNSDNNLQGISLEIDRVTKLQVTKINNIYRVFYYKKPFKVKNIYKEVVINTNFYNDAQKFKLPKNVFYDLVKLLSFSLDFQRDIKKNTSFLVLYENLYDFENNLITTGKILYSKVLFKKKNLEMFYFNRIEGNGKYFDSNGKSIRKTLMKTPIDGARLSSGFGKRRHPILGFNKMHKGIDFAAKKGTPIYAAGDGIIERANFYGGYGRYIRIRHSAEYKTAYAHLSKFAKGIKKNIKVKQGKIIGYVGSSGRSTGPHLHYEVLFNQKQINPNTLKMPEIEILTEKELVDFNSQRATIKQILDNINN